MDIEERDIIVLSDDNSYIVVKKINYNNQIYYYVSDINTKGIFKFLYEFEDQLIEVEDKNIIDNIVAEIMKTIDFNNLMKGVKKLLTEQDKTY